MTEPQTEPVSRITVLLADDHSLVRRGFRRILKDDRDIDVVEEASSGDEAIQLALTLKPQVVVMDCAMRAKEWCWQHAKSAPRRRPRRC